MLILNKQIVKKMGQYYNCILIFLSFNGFPSYNAKHRNWLSLSLSVIYIWRNGWMDGHYYYWVEYIKSMQKCIA